MTTINLRQNQDGDGKRVSMQNANKGFFFSLGILVVTLAIFLGLKPYISILEKDNAALVGEIMMKNNEVVGLKHLEQLMDIQDRVSEINSNLEISNGVVSRIEMNKILDNMSADLYPGVVVSTYRYGDDGSVFVQFDSNNFSDAAKQVFNFKTSENFSNVDLTNITRKENTISCDIVMKLKKA
ncbi:MAG: hypothetical protein US25_C0002G0017 [Candidatus Moranbacteria bacterium GW2011_GWE1_36_7]|nr:MAG: hypothetical protein UR99_C0011G0017 [Candidatus Moranbacteria bacterium GW2011_GWD2_36_12]KKQ06605.1 MAG: hypothetical protein US16_C0013G0017 [Candidatus Moranbacteria bacterium GW2011_GWE2_36_40]KKQ15550.1 MAG: hypothetical protein US25_C0002G0017 [Candidatus Moranbacteria bacterium GW2011_GWE1_36_7]